MCFAQVEGAGLLGVREGDRREVRVRLGLFGHEGDSESATGEQLLAEGCADAVHGCECDGDIRVGADEHGGTSEVFGARVDVLDVGVVAGDLVRTGCCGDGGGDLRVGGGDELDALRVTGGDAAT